jgi:DNA-binding CsgD family transcriptional regulator
MMDKDKKLDDVISVLYETVLHPNRMKEAVGLCGIYAGGVDAQLMTIDKKTGLLTHSLLAETYFSVQGEADYVNHYMAIDPRLCIITEGRLGEWLRCSDVNSENFVKHNEFYQDFLLYYGARYSMVGRLYEDEAQYTAIGALRATNQQPFGEAEKIAAQRFGSHFQRVLHLQKHTQALQTKAELGAMAIDALALSMLIVDNKTRILHLNSSAEKLLMYQTGGLKNKAGHLSCVNLSTQTQLINLITAATCVPAVGGAMFLQDAENYKLFVVPLPAASEFSKTWQIPLALILVMGSSRNVSTLQFIGTLYNLSPAELRVVSSLLEGKSPEQYAQLTGVSMNTVRTQLKNIFRKTNTSRQSELIALLSKIPPL